MAENNDPLGLLSNDNIATQPSASTSKDSDPLGLLGEAITAPVEEKVDLFNLPKPEKPIDIALGGAKAVQDQIFNDREIARQRKQNEAKEEYIKTAKSKITDFAINLPKEEPVDVFAAEVNRIPTEIDPVTQKASEFFFVGGDPYQRVGELTEDDKKQLLEYAQKVNQVKEPLRTNIEQVQKNPSDINANSNLGDLFNFIGDKATATNFYTAALAKEDNDRALSGLGSVYQQINKDQEAKESYQKAINVNPDNHFALTNYAYLAAKDNELDKAEAVIDRVKDKYPDDPYAYQLSSFIKSQKGDDEGAKTDEYLFSQKWWKMNMPEAIHADDPNSDYYKERQSQRAAMQSIVEGLSMPANYFVNLELGTLEGIGEGLKRIYEGAKKFDYSGAEQEGFLDIVNGAAHTIFGGLMATQPLTNIAFSMIPEQVNEKLMQPLTSILKMNDVDLSNMSKNKRAWLELGDTIGSILVLGAVHGKPGQDMLSKNIDLALKVREGKASPKEIKRFIEQGRNLFQQTNLEQLQQATDVLKSIPGDLPMDKKVQVAPLVADRFLNETSLKRAQGAFKKYYQDKLDAIDQKINEIIAKPDEVPASVAEQTIKTAEATAVSPAEVTQVEAKEMVKPEAPKNVVQEEIDGLAQKIKSGAELTEREAQIKASLPEQVNSALVRIGEKPMEVVTPEMKVEVAEPLKDVESTAKALEQVNTAPLEASLLSEIAGGRIVGKSAKEVISETYHADKAAGRETELTKAVEELLKPKEYETETTRQAEKQPMLEGVSDVGDKAKAGEAGAELRAEEKRPVAEVKTEPAEGDIVELEPQIKGGIPRRMVFKDGEWLQQVGNETTVVGNTVKKQAQAEWMRQNEAKAAEAPVTEVKAAEVVTETPESKARKAKLAEILGPKPEKVAEEAPIKPVKTYTAETVSEVNPEEFEREDAKRAASTAKNVVISVNTLVKETTGNQLKLNLHTDQRTYGDAVEGAGGTRQDAESKGFYLGKDGTIHINMETATPETIMHEGFHPILDYLADNNSEIIDSLYKQLESLKGGKEFTEKAKRVYRNKPEVTIKKEAITDFIANVANGDFKITKSNFEAVRDFIIDALKKIGIDLSKPIDLYKPIESITDLKELAQNISEKFKTGEEITIKDVKGINELDIQNGDVVATAKIPEKIKADESKPIQYSNDIDKELGREGIMKESKRGNLSDISGKYMTTTMSDKAMVGNAKHKSVFYFKQGGVLYPLWMKKLGLNRVWASLAKSKMQSLIDNLKVNDDGYSYIGIMSMGKTSHMSNIDTFNFVFDVIENETKDRKSGLTKQILINEINKAYKVKYKTGKSIEDAVGKPKINMRMSITEIKNAILENISHSESAFELRRSFLQSLLGEAKAKEGRLKTVPNYNEIAKMTEEPIIANVDNGDVVAYMKVKKADLKLIKTNPSEVGHHKSYEYAVESSSPIEYVLLNKPVHVSEIYPEFINKSGNKVSFEEAKAKYGEEKARRTHARNVVLSAPSEKVPQWSRAEKPAEMPMTEEEVVPKAKIPGFNRGVERVNEVAEKYKAKTGIKKSAHPPVERIYGDVSKSIADAYVEMKHDPSNPKVKKAYDAMVSETKDQFNHIVEEGIDIVRYTGEGEPYKSSKEMLADLKKGRLMFLPSEEAFGTPEAREQFKDNIGLQKSGVKLKDGYELTNSELFRVVHDYFGHGLLGNEFGAIGEENATLQHLSLFSDDAAPAVIAQTRGQNSWVNFSGTNAEALDLYKQARNAEKQGNLTEAKNLREKANKLFKFAEPKIGLLPEVFNFQKYETAKSIDERIRKGDFTGKQDVGYAVRPDSLPVDPEVARKGSFERRDQKESRRIGDVDVNVSAVYKPLDSVVNGIKKRFPNATIDSEILEITGDPKAFHKLISDSRLENPKGASVFVYPEKTTAQSDGYDQMRLFITPDGKTGVALKKDGSLVSGFSSLSAGKKSRIPQLLLLAIKEGATKADCFHTVLPDYYSTVGFRAISKVKFDPKEKPPAYIDEYGRNQKGWNEEDFKEFNDGQPDVVHLAYDGGDRATIQDRIGQFDDYSSYTKNTIEHKDYDTAVKVTTQASKGETPQFSRGERSFETKEITLADGRKVETKSLPDELEVINGFYSPLQKTILESKQDKMPAKQWIEKFAKGEEAKWTGLQDWLSQQKGSVSKEEIVKYLKDNRISVVEVVKGELTKEQKERKAKILKKIDDLGIEKTSALLKKDNEEVKRIEELEKPLFEELKPLSDLSNQEVTKFSKYQLEGEKSNYKEVLVTLPSKSSQDYKIVKGKDGKYRIKNPDGSIDQGRYWSVRSAAESALVGDIKRAKTIFQSTHFEEPNILVHLRMNTRTDADGNKVLFLEEVQSDWGQTGKREGFKKPFVDKELKDWLNSNREENDVFDKLIDKYSIDTNSDEGLESQLEQKLLEQEKGIPTAPFVMDTNAWTKLGLKVALKEAVAQGADKIAWTTGEQQNARYDLSKSVDEIRSYKYIDGGYGITGNKNGDRVFEQTDIPEDKLPDYVGKDLAEKIIKSYEPYEDGVKVFSGGDLRVGGKGMKGFYGSMEEGTKGIVGGVAEKLFGQKIGKTEINVKQEIEIDDTYIDYNKGKYKLYDKKTKKVLDSISADEVEDLSNREIHEYLFDQTKRYYERKGINVIQPSVDITPELRAEVQKGLPQFSKGERADQKVVEWISNSMKEGATEKEIIDSLKEYDYSEEQINKLIEQSKSKEYAVQERETTEMGAYPVGDEGARGKEKGEGVGQGKQGPEVTRAGEEVPKGEEEQLLGEQEKGFKLNYAGTDLLRQELGLGKREVRESIPLEQTEAEAVKRIKEGIDVNKLADDIINNNRSATTVEHIILTKRIAILDAELAKLDPLSKDFNDKLREIDHLSKASETAGSLAGSQLGIRSKYETLPDDSIASFFIKELDINNGADLTDAQKTQVRKEFDEISAAKKALEEKVAKLMEENAKLKSKKALETAISNRRKNVSKEKLDQEFEDLSSKFASLLKGERATTKAQESRGQFSRADIDDASSLIKKMFANRVDSGMTSLNEIIDSIHGKVGEFGISKEQINDAIAGKYNVAKETRSEAAKRRYDLITEARLISKYEQLKQGVEPKTEKKRIERNQKLNEIRMKIKEHDLTKLAAYKRRIESEIAKLDAKLKSNDPYAFAKPSEKRPIELDAEAKKLRYEYLKKKNERDVRMLKFEYERRASWERARDKFLEVYNVPRTIMSSMDFSAPLRQGLWAGLAHPTYAAKAGLEMFRQSVSQKRFDQWFADVKDDPRYQMSQEAGLYIADPHDPRLSVKEEAFMNNLAEKIPVAGKLIKGSERAYVGYLNKLRWDLFMKFAEQYEKAGKTIENSPELYKGLADYINNSTGRGKLGPLETAAPVLNTVIFSPRLVASRVNLLTKWADPRFYYKVPKEVRVEYFKDVAKFLGVGMTVLALAKLNGATVEDDPRSTDFGKIVVGKTRYDIWGGFQPYVRLIAQIITGEKKTTTTKEIKKLDGQGAFGESRADVIGRFARGKLAPIPSMVVDYLSGRTVSGEEVTLSKEAESRLLPLIYSDVKEAYKDKGVSAIFTVGVPAAFGVGVQTYSEKEMTGKGKKPKVSKRPMR